MPLIDMSLDKLLVYQGRNECPADIDAFWDEGVREMEALGTECELIPTKFQVPGAKCYDLYFTGVGGARIHAVFVRPEKIDTPIPAVAEFHGYTGNCGDIAPKLRWVAAGMCCAAMDCRGQGGKSEDNGQVVGNTHRGHIIRGLDEEDPRKLYFRNVFLDTAQLVRILMAMPFVDETKVGAYGGSQGGGLTYACACLTPTLNRAAARFPFLSDYRRVWEMDLAESAYVELKEYFRRFDPRHEREAEVFTKLGYIDIHNMSHRIKAKLLMYTGLMDKICPPSTQFAAFNRVTSEKKYMIWPDFGHESLPDHEDLTMQYMLEMVK